jgi:hypothetical protein
MTTTIHLSERPAIEYPESDGLPIADNTIQFRWKFGLTTKETKYTKELENPGNRVVRCRIRSRLQSSYRSDKAT